MASNACNLYVFGFKKMGHEIVYRENLGDDFKNFDIYIVSSIVCCETEVNN